MNNLEVLFLFCSTANIQYPMSAAVYLRSILISSLRWDSNVVLTLRLETGAPAAIQHKWAQLAPTSCNHWAREKSLLQKGIVIGLVCSLKSYLESEVQAACWTKILRHISHRISPRPQVFHKEMIYHLSKENETPVSKSD